MKVMLPDFSHCTLLVAGDVMLDRYWTGGTSRISPEAPVPVVKVDKLEERAGGAANVALNIASLGCSVSVAGVVGNDDPAKSLNKLLLNAGVSSHFVSCKDCNTITKLRVLSRHQQLIRLDFEDNELQSGSAALVEYVSGSLENINVLVLSDYAKGSLVDIRRIIESARKSAISVVIDPKGNDFTKYAGATLLTPNQAEFEAIAGISETDGQMEQRARAMLEKLQLHALLVTRGEKGMMLVEQGQPVFNLSARARDVFDVTGAGDTVVGVLASCMAAGESLRDSAVLANIAAGITVTRLGAHSVTPAELRSEMYTAYANGSGVVSREQLLLKVAASRGLGEKIVFTNGCFDLLHAGHVAYLQKAAELGNRLIVAVNDDASVAKLKGSNRPINSLADRMSVLSALSCVDWVVSFGEDTPRDLIGDVVPDILVKGGDYKPTDIAGHDIVTDNGGRVEIIPLVEGVSTTGIVNRILGN